MKNRNVIMYMLSLAGMLGLWSCSTDEAISGGGLVASGEKVPVTITISRGVQTRTELSENTTNGGLNQIWSEGDVVKLYNSNGVEAGTLELQSGANTSEGIFTGEVKGETGTYRLWYFGKPQANAETSYPYLDFSTTAGQVKLDLEKQNFKSLDELEAVDILSTNVNIVVNDGKGTVGQAVTMAPHVAMARFTMSGIPEGTSGTVKIYNNLNSDRGGIYARRSLSLFTGEQQGGNGTTTSFTYNEVKNGDNIYVAFIPNAYTLHFEFEASSGAKYTHTFGQNSIKAGVYYRSFNKEDEAETGTIGGIEVPMQLSEKYTLRYHANFEGAEPESFEDVQYKAPAVFTLKGYADTGLPSREGYTFLGWATSESATQPDITDSSITLNETEKNKPRDVYAVWEETKKSYNPGDTGSWGGENIDPAYELGTVTWTTDEDCWTVNCRNMAHTGGFGTYITYTHNGIQNNLLTSKGTTAYFFQWGRWLGYPSTAARTYFQNDEVYGSYPVSSQYLNGINIYNTKLGYVGDDGLVPSYVAAYMGGNNSFTRKKALNWSILFGMVSSFVGHGDYIYANEECSWEERCGNPCPDGYRVPTASELEALIPTTGEISGKYAEIKKINGVSYAMRWQVVTGNLPYVEIKSIKTSLTQITFDNAIFNSAPAIRLYAYGYMDNEGDLQGRGSVGVYWSSESGVNTISNTTGNGGKYLEIDFSGSKAVMGIDVALRCFGAPVMPIKDDNAETATLTPLLPLIVYHEDCKFF